MVLVRMKKETQAPAEKIMKLIAIVLRKKLNNIETRELYKSN